MEPISKSEVGIDIPLKPDDSIALERPILRATPILNELLLSRVILAIAVGVGTFLRLWEINAMGLNTDEAVYSGQAAAIAGVPGLKNIFPIFRAHPLLFQFVLSLIYRIHFSDVEGRLVAVVIGIGTVILTYELGKIMYGRIPGAFAAILMALMPYHVVVSRQVLLDGPMVFFATLTLYTLARYGNSQKVVWLFAAGASLGLTFLSKETSIILVASVYMFLALSSELRVRIRDLILATLIMGVVIAPYPLAILFAGGSSTGRNYLTWQLFRRPNHEVSFYLTSVPPAVGILLIIVAVLGLVLLWREHSWREKLLLSWILVQIIFFQIWPVKGYQYLLPIAPPLALLAGRVLGKFVTKIQTYRLPSTRKILSIPPIIAWVVMGILVLSSGYSSWLRIQPEVSSLFLAGTGGVPGGRETGAWIQKNVPLNANILTIGPSMANIIEFYGQRIAYGLSTSPNPLHRNPSYEAVLNPDLQIRDSDLQYLVWDSFSAARTPFFSDQLAKYVNKYNGRAVFTDTIPQKDSKGNLVSVPVIIVYEVHP